MADQPKKPARASSRTKADKVVLVAAIAVAIALAGGLTWLHFAWKDTAQTTVAAGSKVGLPTAETTLTQAQRDNQQMYVHDSQEHSAQQWLAFQLMLNDGSLAKMQAHDLAVAKATATAMASAGGQGIETTTKAASRIQGLDDTRIDGSSIDAMVNSINQITAALPDHYARVFQLSLRILLVHDLPLDKMTREHINPATATEATLLGNAQQQLSGMTALDVMKAAATLRAKLRQEQKDHTGPFASHDDKTAAAQIDTQQNQ